MILPIGSRGRGILGFRMPATCCHDVMTRSPNILEGWVVSLVYFYIEVSSHVSAIISSTVSTIVLLVLLATFLFHPIHVSLLVYDILWIFQFDNNTLLFD